MRDLTVSLTTGEGFFRAVDSVSFALNSAETLALVGESGCGKTMTALAILRLLPARIAMIEQGEIRLDGQNLAQLSERDLRGIRGRKIGMIFQEPLSALNPVYSVGEQVAESLRHHERLSRRAAWGRAVESLQSVGIPDAARRARDYPHQFSGGMRQRVMIACAIACNPVLLIADEPTTALDVSVQKEILDLLRRLQVDRNMAILLITHDLGVVAEMARHMAVMYAGEIVEHGEVSQVLSAPAHPYTRALLNSIPRMDGGIERLQSIEGTVPDLRTLPVGCRFRERCGFTAPPCTARQELVQMKSSMVRCCRAGELFSATL